MAKLYRCESILDTEQEIDVSLLGVEGCLVDSSERNIREPRPIAGTALGWPAAAFWGLCTGA